MHKGIRGYISNIFEKCFSKEMKEEKLGQFLYIFLQNSLKFIKCSDIIKIPIILK